MMRFASGKMSSRKGNVITGESLIADAKQIVYEKMTDRDFTEQEREAVATAVGVAAVKYSILRQATGGDILFDFEKSISFEGDSGPYLQYTAIRARAVLTKAQKEGITAMSVAPESWTTTDLEKYLYRFSEVVLHAYNELQPHYITTYLTELASYFNTFYGSGKIVDSSDDSSAYRVALTEAFLGTMENGLAILGISVPEKM
jgi:arginyl-tRNA synthetase